MVDIELKIRKDWFRSEVRNGHYVSREKKEIWAIELDLLHKVQKICKKYNIKWWVDGGTMLGAVRHGGFIPWDDDIDIMMTRENYNKFIDVAKYELNEPYFLQTDWTDNVYYCHAKLRRSDTTCVLEKDKNARFEFNQGIFIDIFPFDNVPDHPTHYQNLINQLGMIKQEMLIARTRWWLYEDINYEILEHCKQLRDHYDEIRQSYNCLPDHCSGLGNLGLPSLKNNIVKYKTELEKTAYFDFEMLRVPVPIGYHTILTRLYGDYMKPVKNASKHGVMYFDTDTSYKYTPIFDLPFTEESNEIFNYKEWYNQKYGWDVEADYSQLADEYKDFEIPCVMDCEFIDDPNPDPWWLYEDNQENQYIQYNQYIQTI